MCTWECAERHGVSLRAGTAERQGPAVESTCQYLSPDVPSGRSAATWETDKCCIHYPSKMEIDSCLPQNAFYDLRTRGQTSLHGYLLLARLAVTGGKKRVAFGGFHSEIKQWKKQAGD